MTITPARLLHYLRFVGSSFKRRILVAVFCVQEFPKHPKFFPTLEVNWTLSRWCFIFSRKVLNFFNLFFICHFQGSLMSGVSLLSSCDWLCRRKG